MRARPGRAAAAALRFGGGASIRRCECFVAGEPPKTVPLPPERAELSSAMQRGSLFQAEARLGRADRQPEQYKRCCSPPDLRRVLLGPRARTPYPACPPTSGSIAARGPWYWRRPLSHLAQRQQGRGSAGPKYAEPRLTWHYSVVAAPRNQAAGEVVIRVGRSASRGSNWERWIRIREIA